MALNLPRVPNPDAEIAEAGGHPTRDWLRFFYELIAALTNRVPVTGSATFAAATSVAVTFTTAEAAATYDIFVAAADDNYHWASSKATTGFTLNAKNSTSVTVRWQLIRA